MLSFQSSISLTSLRAFNTLKKVREMVQRTGGPRKKTRKKLRKSPRTRGKIKIRKELQAFKTSERVRIIQESSAQRGMPHPKFKNLVGTVIKKQGKAYLIKIKDSKKDKEVISTSIHLERL